MIINRFAGDRQPFWNYGRDRLLFCAASATDWQHAGITGENVTAMVVKGLISRDAVGTLTLTDRGHVVLRSMLPDL